MYSTHPCVSRYARLRRTKMFLTFCQTRYAVLRTQHTPANTKNAHKGRIFLLVVEAAGIEPASANPLPLVLHA